MRALLIFFCVLILFAPIKAQHGFHWSERVGGNSFEIGSCIVNDKTGNVLVSGGFLSDTVDFDPTAGVFPLYSVNGTGFLMKLDSLGNFLWALNLSGTGNSVAIDKNGNAFVPGSSGGDAFVSKVSPTGSLVWTKVYGGNSVDDASAIEVDKNDNIVISGSFKDTVDFDPGTGVYNLITGTYYQDIYVAKWDNLGNFLWAKSFVSSQGGYPYSITTDKNNNILHTGIFVGTCNFDPGASNFSLSSSGSGTEIYVEKLDPSGNFIWVKQFEATNGAQSYSIKTDLNGNVYSTGWFSNSVDFDPGTASYNLTSVGYLDVFISKLDSTGGFIWAKSIGGTDQDVGFSINLKSNSHVLIAGKFQSTVDFDPSPATYNLSAAWLNSNAFLCELDASGNFVCASNFGSNDVTQATSISCFSDKCYLTGSFAGTVDFDPTVGIANLTSNAWNDIFICKFSACGVSTGEYENIKISPLRLFPNPSSNEVFVTSAEVIVNVKIINALGKSVFEMRTDQQEFSLRVGSFPRGIYFVQIQSEKSSSTLKLVVE